MNRILIVTLLLFLPATLPAGNDISILALFKDKALVRIDGRQVVLVAGQPREGVLLVSSNSREAIIEIDGVRASYGLDNAISSTYAGPSGRRTVSITPDEQGMYWVDGSINGHPVQFVVDTGATLISMNRQHAARLGIDYLARGEKNSTVTASGQDTIYVVMLDRVKVGDLQFSDVTASVHDSDFPQVILLGNSFLNRVDMRREGGLLQLMDRTP